MFRALRISSASTSAADSSSPKPRSRVDLVEDFDDGVFGDEGEGDVTVDVEYSSINFKDGLALAGRPGIAKIDPLIPGIDLVGTVATSADPRWKAGDAVIVNGFGMGEGHNGGLSERARVSADWLVARPEAISPERAAAIGTAGYTAMLCVLALERAQATGSGTLDGDVLVTGAAGGVGSVAIALLARLGHRVTASTGRMAEADYLRTLGAADVIDRTPLGESGKPLQRQRWSGAVDSAGGATLANVLAQLNYGGTVAACGLAQSSDLPTTVLPFILRGVSLAGIDSVYAPLELRQTAWNRLASDLDLDLLDSMTTTVPLADAPAQAERILAGQVRGRIAVDVRA
jgi:acrylyl-CoA reductase (NADPH)